MRKGKVIDRLKQFKSKKTKIWSFAPNFDFWDNKIFVREMEELSGVYEKINLINTFGNTHIIGGFNTGGNDDIFTHQDGNRHLDCILEDIPIGDNIFLYCPHPFWSNLTNSFKWMPSWNDLYSYFSAMSDWCIFQYSPSFDTSGRYFFIARKSPREKALVTIASISKKTFHVFYFPEGGDISLSRSNMALSAHLCIALTRVGAKVYAHHMNDIDALNMVNKGDILIGHVGQWVKVAYDKGLRNIILYNPANRWYPTRGNDYFEKNATIGEQIQLASMVIAQSGSIWRLTTNVSNPEKWRWIDLGVDPQLFPLIKRKV